MKKQSSPSLVLVILVGMCLVALYIFLPATSPLSSIRDSDGDGHADAYDTFPHDNTEWRDTDKDGYGDRLDKYPTNPLEWRDSDNDTWPDNIDRFPFDTGEHSDLDGDGVGDGVDAFPKAASQYLDSDGDGYGDNSTGYLGDAFPDDRYEWNDTDHDGFGDNQDSDPNDPEVWGRANATLVITLTGLMDEGFSLLADGVPLAEELVNHSQYATIEMKKAWLYGDISSIQLQLTAIAYQWSIDHWEVTAQTQEIVIASNGGTYFLALGL